MEGEVNWVQLAIEAPLSALVVLTLYKCYRARGRLKLDSECCLWLFPHLRVKLDYTMPGAGDPAPALSVASSDETSSGTPIEIITDSCPQAPAPTPTPEETDSSP